MSRDPYLDLQHGPVDLGGRDVSLLPVLQGLIAGVPGLCAHTPTEEIFSFNLVFWEQVDYTDRVKKKKINKIIMTLLVEQDKPKQESSRFVWLTQFNMSTWDFEIMDFLICPTFLEQTINLKIKKIINILKVHYKKIG